MFYWRLPFILTREEALRQVSRLDVWWILRALIDYGCRAQVVHTAEDTLSQAKASVKA